MTASDFFRPAQVRSSGLSGPMACFLLFLVSCAMFLPGFASLPPMDRDEPRFAQATKQMLETGDYVVIRFQDEARNKKPVGIYWMQAAVVSAAGHLGMPEARTRIWLYRIPSLLGAMATVLLTYWAARGLGSPGMAFLAGLFMASTILLGVEARLAKTDAVVAATVAATLPGAHIERISGLGETVQVVLGPDFSGVKYPQASGTALTVSVSHAGSSTPTKLPSDLTVTNGADVTCE